MLRRGVYETSNIKSRVYPPHDLGGKWGKNQWIDPCGLAAMDMGGHPHLPFFMIRADIKALQGQAYSLH
jgi:hypothetical protein